MKGRTDKGNLCGTLDSGKPPLLSLLRVANLPISKKIIDSNLKKILSTSIHTWTREKPRKM